jgi:hypothetical protein
MRLGLFTIIVRRFNVENTWPRDLKIRDGREGDLILHKIKHFRWLLYCKNGIEREIAGLHSHE